MNSSETMISRERSQKKSVTHNAMIYIAKIEHCKLGMALKLANGLNV